MRIRLLMVFSARRDNETRRLVHRTVAGIGINSHHVCTDKRVCRAPLID